MIGTTVSHYRIVGQLGEGGMGKVYEGRDLRLDRPVAIKVLPETQLESAEAKERFQREARSASALNHPHICTIYDVGEHDGQPFLVMERMAGRSLKSTIGGEPLPIERVVILGEQIADALEAAHGAGILHRDIKPDNVFVTERGEAKVLDFGLAKEVQEDPATTGGEAEQPTMSYRPELTRSGSTLGTAAYMSPEQARGERVDARSDLFSLGAVLYEMATGRRPFPGQSQAEVFQQLLGEAPVPPSTLNPEVPPELERIILACLEKDPATRCQSAAQVRAELRRLRREETEAPLASPSPAPEPPFAAAPGRRKLRVGLAAGAAVAVVLVAVWLGRGRLVDPPGAAVSRAATSSVAVLPFADLSPEGDQEYLGDGIAEELLSALGQIQGLRVASRTSSFSFKGQSLDVKEIGQRLGVDAVIEGSVRRSGERLRIEARLVNVADGFHAWSDRFDTETADVFAVQDAIALSVVEAFQLRLSGGSTEVALKGQTTDHLAQDLYLNGRFAWNRRTQEGLERAVGFFEQAVARDPRYARALVGLGDAYAVLGFYDYRPPSEAFPRAQDAARRALAIEPTMAEAHATLGYAALYYDWDWEEAERQFRRALELNPEYPVAHQWYANYLTAMGRFEEAGQEMRAASERDPLSMIAAAATGWVHLYAREYARAVRQLDDVIALDPTFELAYLWGGQAHAGLGRLEEAESQIRKTVELSSGSSISRAALARVLALGGRANEARGILEELEREGEGGYVPSYEIARAYVGLRELDTAAGWLERAYEEHAHSMAFLAVDPQLQPLHGHPRYEALRRRLRFRE